MIIIIEKRKKKNETVERKTAKWLASSSWVDYLAVLSIFLRVRLIVFFVWTAIQFRVFVVDGERVCVCVVDAAAIGKKLPCGQRNRIHTKNGNAVLYTEEKNASPTMDETETIMRNV